MMQSSIAVIGAGEMGHGIAEICAIAGYGVLLCDVDKDRLNKALRRINISLRKLSRSKKNTLSLPAEKIMDKISTAVNYRNMLYNKEMVFEAVPEDLLLKKNIFGICDKVTPSDCILATNTSHIPVSEIAEAAESHPERVLGVHFFNPPVIMKAVEVIAGKETDPRYTAKIIRFLKNLGKTPVEVKDSPGFAVNRVLMSAQVLLIRAVEKGLTTPSAVDNALIGLGIPMGAFATMDFVGLDTVYKGMKIMADRLGEEYRPARWLEELVKTGRLGMKTGKGIYRWKNDRPVITPLTDRGNIFPLDIMLVQLNEAAKIVEEGIVKSFKEIDLLIRNGTGNRIGLEGLTKSLSMDKILERLDYISSELGIKMFKPCRYLLSLIKKKDKQKEIRNNINKIN